MELRDAFAAAWLTGQDVGSTEEGHAKAAQFAYQVADAMLAARGPGSRESLLNAKERFHAALGCLNDVEPKLGDGPNAEKIREALEEMRLGMRTLREYVSSADAAAGE